MYVVCSRCGFYDTGCYDICTYCYLAEMAERIERDMLSDDPVLLALLDED